MNISISRDQFYVTSDLHFFHSNIIRYCNRPWKNVDEMNEGLIRNWNSYVPHNAKVFILGDIAMGGRRKELILAEFLARLNGEKYLVPGNHDTYILRSTECLKQITVLDPLFEVKVFNPKSSGGSQRIVMCHYAMKVWNKSHHGAWHLYGHSHHTMPPDYNIKAFDVGIDGKNYNYRPLSYADVENIMTMHGQKIIDHHNESTKQ